MIKNLLNIFFPIPNFLRVPSFGLDISDESLKFVKLTQTSRGIKVSKYGEQKIAPGIIEAGKIKNFKKMEEILTSLRNQEKMKAVRVSLPEEQVYLFKLRLEKKGLVNIREGIELTLEEYVPIPAQEAVFDYDILSQNEYSLEVQVAVIPKGVIEGYLSVFKNVSILVKSFEPEALAITRAI